MLSSASQPRSVATVAATRYASRKSDEVRYMRLSASWWSFGSYVSTALLTLNMGTTADSE